MHRGYIKLWRKIEDWTWFSDVSLVGIFIHFLIRANHKDSTYQGHSVPRGSFVCGINALAKQTKLTPQKLRTIFIKLKSTQEITIKSTNKFSIVSIVNFHQYQENSTNKITSKITNEQQSDNKQVTTS